MCSRRCGWLARGSRQQLRARGAHTPTPIITSVFSRQSVRHMLQVANVAALPRRKAQGGGGYRTTLTAHPFSQFSGSSAGRTGTMDPRGISSSLPWPSPSWSCTICDTGCRHIGHSRPLFLKTRRAHATQMPPWPHLRRPIGHAPQRRAMSRNRHRRGGASRETIGRWERRELRRGLAGRTRAARRLAAPRSRSSSGPPRRRACRCRRRCLAG